MCGDGEGGGAQGELAGEPGLVQAQLRQTGWGWGDRGGGSKEEVGEWAEGEESGRGGGTEAGGSCGQ
jgi:hypothetical protein